MIWHLQLIYPAFLVSLSRPVRIPSLMPCSIDTSACHPIPRKSTKQNFGKRHKPQTTQTRHKESVETSSILSYGSQHLQNHQHRPRGLSSVGVADHVLVAVVWLIGPDRVRLQEIVTARLSLAPQPERCAIATLRTLSITGSTSSTNWHWQNTNKE